MSGTEHCFEGADKLQHFADDDIVITGISGRFPQADDMQELKDNLFNKRNCIITGEDRWPSSVFDNCIGKLNSLNVYDAEFFNTNVAAAHVEDPQVRIFNEVCYEAIIDSGYDPKELSGNHIGVFVGLSDPDPMSLSRERQTEVRFKRAVGLISCFISNKISHRYNLTGPSFAVDTACSSSASAVEEAFRRMKDGSIKAALVGGASLCLSPAGNKLYLDLGMLSSTGETCSYSEKANGFAVGEAISIAFLQKKKDARRIYAKVHNIESMAAVSQREGTYIPSLEDQVNLYKHTYSSIGMEPSLVDYIEGNGASTPEADAAEVNAIDMVFCEKRKEPLLLGTVKSNIGHTESAAALCSIAKVVIAFESGAIAPNIHYAAPNPMCSSLTNSKVKVVAETTPYDRPLAAINSFGYGGTIVHMILGRNGISRSTEHKTSVVNIPRLVVYAATTEEALTYMFNCVQQNEPPDEFFALLNKSAYNPPLIAPYRGFTILKKDTPSAMSIERISPIKRQVWYLFTGICCSEWLGIGLELMDIQMFEESLRKSAKILEPFDIDLLELLHPNNLQQEIRITPVLVTTTAIQIAFVDVLNALGLEPDGIVGHSTGELVCSYADGCSTAEQTILLAYHTGVSVDQAKLPPGAMAVVGLTSEEAKRRCPEGVYTACHDAEDIVTVSGSAEAIKTFVEELKKESVFASVINTKGFAFHCSNISAASENMRRTLKTVYSSVQPRSKRWISTSYSEEECNEPQSKSADADYYCHNLETEVRFKEVLTRIPCDAIIIEIGPHFLVSSVVKKDVGDKALCVDIPERSDKSIDSFLSSIGKLYNMGLNPQVENLYEPVSYPVPRGTPMISPLIKWDHSKSYEVQTYMNVPTGQSTFVARTTSSMERFLLDHCIEGRPLYPAAGYLYLAWNALNAALGKPGDTLSVCIENFKIVRATILSASEDKVFQVKILDKSGEFEISEGDSAVATGKIYASEKTVFDDSLYHFEPKETAVLVSGSDIYNELKIHGYEYGPAFQGLLEINAEGTEGLVKWNDEWISFLDSLLLFFGTIHENEDFKLPTGALSVKIDPNVHMQFVSRMKEKEIKGIPVKYDKFIRKCITPGVEIRDLKLEAAPRRSIFHGISVMEEYSFVPDYEKDEIFGTKKTENCESYIKVCNHLAKQVVNSSEICGKLRSVFEDIKFDENVKDQELLFSEDENAVLLGSLRNIVEMSLSKRQAAQIEAVCQNISDVLVEDMLFKCVLSEKPLRSILDVAMENLLGKMNIAEWCDSTPLLLTAVQGLIKSSIMTKASYVLIHSQVTNLDAQNLNERGIQVEHAGTGDVPSSLKDSCHLGMTCCIALSRDSLMTRIHNLVSMTKEGGFILVIHKHELTLAELLIYTLSKLSFTLRSEAEIEKLFQDEKLTVISKKSSSFGINAYLLRKVTKKPQPPEVYVVKVLDGKYDQWVEDIKKNISVVQERGNTGVVLLIAQGTTVNGIIGLSNCLRQEPGGDKVKCIFTDSSSPPFDPKSSFYADVLAKNLFMNVFINGKWGSFRHTTLPTEFPRDLSDCASIQCAKPGDLSSLEWWECPIKINSEKEGSKELYHVYYSSVNFKDVMIATGKISASTFEVSGHKTGVSPLGFEFSGRDKNGRRVMGVTSGGSLCNSYVNKPVFVSDVPDNWTLEEAATVPVVYITCYYALMFRGELQRGESILIHSGTGGVGQAAIRIALSMDCEIFTTVGTPEKRDFLMKTFPQLKPENIGCSRNTTFEEMIMTQTKGEGVDVVLNSLADDKFQASVRCLGNNGRFLEIGKYDLQMDSALGLQVFEKGISFHSCQLDAHFQGNPKSNRLFAYMNDLMSDAIRKGVVQPLNTTVFSKDDVEKAFRYMGTGTHIGKVLIKIREEEEIKTIIPSPLIVEARKTLSLFGNKSYIIVGGLGGFGIELAKWLVKKGAGTVILTSRYGARTPYHHMCLKRWKASGARVFVSTLNVTKRDEAQRLLEETSISHGPIGGIFNSAVVLKDAFIENQTASAFEEVCAPKALATKELDELTRAMCPEMDMFVCFSSISCGKGNAGQTNYGYANSVMERICEQRKKDGLHGLAIQWGIIGNVGLVHRRMGDDAMIAGVIAQKIKSCLQCLEKFLLEDKAVVSSFVLADKSAKKSKIDDILSQIAGLLGVAGIEEINPHRTFAKMGIDSIAGVELRQLLQEALDDPPTLQQLQGMNIGDIKELMEDQEKKDQIQPAAQNIQSIIFNGLPTSLAREAVVAANNVGNGVPIFVIHGNDYLHDDYKTFYEGLSYPVFALQSNEDTPTTSLKDMSQWFLAEIQKVCPRTPVHLVSIGSSGSLALQMTLLSEEVKGEQPEIISFTILDGSADLMDILSTTQDEKKKNGAAYEASDLCEFLSMFTNSDLTQLKNQLEGQSSLQDRMKTISNLSTLSDQSSFLAAAEFHVKKQNLMRLQIPEGTMKQDITAVEAAEKVLPNDVSAVKTFLSEICKGNATIHRNPGSDKFLVDISSAKDVAAFLNDLYKRKS